MQHKTSKPYIFHMISVYLKYSICKFVFSLQRIISQLVAYIVSKKERVVCQAFVPSVSTSCFRTKEASEGGEIWKGLKTKLDGEGGGVPPTIQ